jgi:carbon storage regulator CsrA
MLVLTRKLQEQIRIGNDIVITVLEFRGSSIRLGIEAPRDVRVMREELPRREITIDLNDIQATNEDKNTCLASFLAEKPAGNADVQVIELDRKSPVRSSVDQRVVNSTRISSPLASKLNSRRAGSTPNTAALAQESDPRPEVDMFGQDHLLAAQKENNRSFSSAV